MSYILDALRKSETERRQGRVPDLGQQVQFIHKPKKRSSLALWVVIAALLVNAGVLAYIFWPTVNSANQTEQADTQPVPDRTLEGPDVVESAPTNQPDASETEAVENKPESTSAAAEPAEPEAIPETKPEQVAQQRPTIIVPSSAPSVATPQTGLDGPAPHLVELPVSFQRSIPDLTFNSHIYASDPSSRRVMINNNYLRVGESFSGITVAQITEEGVVLSKNGQRFRVGIVRDWVSPQ